MRRTPASPFPYSHLSSHTQPLVPTIYASSFRDTGKYESRASLPNLDLLLDQTLKAIAQSHESRERSARSFDVLWKKVCLTLRKKKNAASYERWKRTEVIKNIQEIRELDEELAAAWFRPSTSEGEGAQRIDWGKWETLSRRRATLQPTAKVTTDDVLEVAIAYWIEAKNARNAGDDLRVLHALIECSLHIGVTLAPKTESESKSEAGSKQGKEARDAVAGIATEVLRNIQVDARMKDPDFLLGEVVDLIQANPKHAALLKAYDKRATAGKKVLAENTTADRFTETLRKWVTSKKQPYSELSDAYSNAMHRAADPKPPMTTRARCQANS